MLYMYNSVIHGVSARLTDEEAKSLENLSCARNTGDVIVGVNDMGMWPEHKSFDDMGLGSIPANWKGKCEEGTNFKVSDCNRKLIGARFFCKGYEAILGPIDESTESKSPRDDDGHGTHTASTAAGSALPVLASLDVQAGQLEAWPHMQEFAAYKACWLGGCFTSDILAAMEAAIDDGVNVLSMSTGGSISDYNRDTVAVGAFSAMRKGILVSCSAGNAGPDSGILSKVAP